MQNFMYNTPTQVFFGRRVEKEIGPQLKCVDTRKSCCTTAAAASNALACMTK